MPSACSVVFLLCILVGLCIAQQNLCVNDQDKAAFLRIKQLHEQDPIHNPDFHSIFNGCIKEQIIPSAGYVSWCCQQKIGLTQDCSSCMGNAITCVLGNCKWACAFQGQAACEACFVQYCNDGLRTCIGYDVEGIQKSNKKF